MAGIYEIGICIQIENSNEFMLNNFSILAVASAERTLAKC